MLSKLKAFITWPIAAVLIAGGLVYAALLIFAPPDVRHALLTTSGVLLGANGLVWTLVAAQLTPGGKARPSTDDSEGPPTRNLRPPPGAALCLAFAIVVLACAGCEVRRARVKVARIQRECSAAYENAATPEQVDEIDERCSAAYEEVRRGR